MIFQTTKNTKYTKEKICNAMTMDLIAWGVITDAYIHRPAPAEA